MMATSGSYHPPTSSTGGGAIKFRTVQPLVAGLQLIAHNLNLQFPFATEVAVRDAVTGAEIAVRVMPGAETANAVSVFVPTACASAQITVI